jgi:hypothetical protein
MNQSKKMNGLFLRLLSKKLSTFNGTMTDVKYLGRWRIENCYTTVHRKVDYANEDHCGVCANGVNQKKETEEEDMDEYIRYML